MNDIYPVGLTTEDCSVKLTVGWKKPGSFVRQYQDSSHYLTGGSIPPLSTSHMTIGGVRTGRVYLIYKCNKYPEQYFRAITESPP